MIYLDHHATTPCDPEIVAAMLPWMTQQFANPHSDHAAGRQASEAIDAARELIAASMGVPESAVLFTSGATESNNLAIRGICTHPRQKKRHIISVTTEHPAVLDVLDDMKRDGFRVTLIDVLPNGDEDAGKIDLDQLADAIDDDTALVSVMWANNEIGTIAPIKTVAEICHQRGVPLHSDATQVLGRIPIDILASNVDLVSFSAHKCYGPKGIGMLIAGNGNRRIRLRGQILGGGQQQNLRSGTMAPAMIVAMAKTVEMAIANLSSTADHASRLRDRLWRRLDGQIDGLRLNGIPLSTGGRLGEPNSGPVDRLPNNLNFYLPKIEGEAWMAATPEVAFSTGSACSNTKAEPSHVLTAIGLSESQARQCVRFGIGRGNTEQEIDEAADLLLRSFEHLTG